ncbi:MAG: 3-deoxy-D-manno-octulosonic acid transferase, partial [Thermoguttaceae bacterium]|nr:3-deoxy-D-manno-octulosonic acid transferase [Thermoguttaceae bacterium]
MSKFSGVPGAGFALDLLYLGALVCASPFLAWRSIRGKKYREGYAQKFFGRVPRLDPPAGRRIWFHAVSVGEVNLVKPIAAALRQAGYDGDFVVSATSKTGFDLARALFDPETGTAARAAAVFYCPLDFTWAVRAAFRRIRPTALALVELELWPNLIAAAKSSGADVFVLNGRIGDGSFKNYRRARPLLAPTFRRIDAVLAQDELNAARFRDLSPVPERASVVGSLKFDGARTDRDNPGTRRLAALAGIEPDDVVFLAGSTQAPEEAAALETFARLEREFPRLKLIIVPRHKERFEEVAEILAKSGRPWARRSALSDVPGENAPERVLLVDSVGELSDWW